MLSPQQDAPNSAAVDDAIDRGVGFLANELDRGGIGLWRDYTTQDGRLGSTVWASGFIAAHVGRIEAARPLAARVVDTLVSLRRPSGGWGYDENLLEDCDSTAWVLLAARRCGVRLPRDLLIRSLRFLLAHQAASGGFVTYGSYGVELFGDVAGRDGWFSPQPCVTAAALLGLLTAAPKQLPAIHDAMCFLVGRSGADDLWHPYWWHGFSYATYHAVEALADADGLTGERAAAVVAALSRARCGDGGWPGQHPGRSTSFATALCVLASLRLSIPTHELESAVQLLLDGQLHTGAFEPSAELLVPGGEAGQSLTMVDSGLFTTASVLHALDEFRAATADRTGARGAAAQ